MMEYKGYQAQVGYDAESQAFHGQVINLRDVITFRATSVAGLHRELAASIEDYLEFCSSRGEEPERPTWRMSRWGRGMANRTDPWFLRYAGRLRAAGAA